MKKIQDANREIQLWNCGTFSLSKQHSIYKISPNIICYPTFEEGKMCFKYAIILYAVQKEKVHKGR